MAAQLCGHYDDKDQDYNRADHEGGDRPAFVVLGDQTDEGQDEADAPGIANKDEDEAEQRADITAIPAVRTVGRLSEPFSSPPFFFRSKRFGARRVSRCPNFS